MREAARGRLRGVLPAALILAATISGCVARTPRAGPSTPVAKGPPVAVARPGVVEPHASWQDAVLYFAILDRFADGEAGNNRDVRRREKGAFHGGDLAGLTEQLDEIASLGATAIWITPVVQNVPGFVTGAGFPDWAYHGYWADDFTRLDPRFGTEEQLAELVEAAHERGIAVLLDVVYNHVGYGSRYLDDPLTRRWLRTEADGTCGTDDVTSCLAGLPDLRTELPEVAAYLMSAHLGLAARTGIDGFRLDTVKHVSHEFWKAHRERVDAELGEDFFLLGEVWGGDAEVLDPWFAADELDAGFDFGFAGNTLAFLQGRGRPIAYNRYLENREKVRDGHLLAHYLSSHDVPTALHQLGDDVELFRLATLLQMTVSGIPVLYYGEEVGREGGEWPENRSDMPWGDRDVLPGAGLPRDEALRADVARAIAIRRAHAAALARGTQVALPSEGDLLLFLRQGADGETVLVAVNRGAEPAAATLDMPAAWSGASALRDVWNQEPLVGGGAELRFEVAPRSARIVVAEGS